MQVVDATAARAAAGNNRRAAKPSTSVVLATSPRGMRSSWVQRPQRAWVEALSSGASITEWQAGQTKRSMGHLFGGWPTADQTDTTSMAFVGVSLLYTCDRAKSTKMAPIRRRPLQNSGPPTPRWDVPLKAPPCTWVIMLSFYRRAAMIASTSYTQPPQVPPPTRCSAAHSRVSSGKSGSAARSGRGGRRASTRAPSSAPYRVSPSPTRSTLPSSRLRSMTISNHVAVAHLADRAAGQRLRPDVADARPGRDAGKAGVGQRPRRACRSSGASAPT